MKCLWRFWIVRSCHAFCMGLKFGGSDWASACFSLKRYLNVASRTPNTKVYGETGRYPLFVTTVIKAVKYWLRVVMLSPERHTRKAYNMLVSMDNTGKQTWATWVRTFLCSRGFGHVWLYQGMGDIDRFIFSQRKNNSFVCAKLTNENSLK